MIRAVAYCRFSSDNQRTESIDAQLKAITEYCERKGYVLIGTYPDEAKSATNDNRPAFQRMIADSAKGKFDKVLVHKLDRFARDRYDSAFYKRELRNHNVQLESVLEQFDNSPESIILESVLEGMAEYYSKNLGREARKGMLQNASKAIHAGGRPPYGYRLTADKHLEIDEHAAKAVVIYFEGIDTGQSLAAIANRLNALGYRTQRGKLFNKNSFDGWASNRKYIGNFTWDVATPKRADGKRNSHQRKSADDQIVLESAIPAIVDRELWERVNAKMEARQHKGAQMKAKQVYLLTGKIFCGECGNTYRGQSYLSKGKRFSYYKCDHNCGNKPIRKDIIEDHVMGWLLDHIFNEESTQSIIDEVQRRFVNQKVEQEADIEPIEREIKELQRKIDAWTELIVEGIKSIVAKIKDAEMRVEALEHELKRIKMTSRVDRLDSRLILERILREKDLLMSGSEEAKRQVVQQFVEKIIITYDPENDRHCTDVTVRLLGGGGEASPLKNLSITTHIMHRP